MFLFVVVVVVVVVVVLTFDRRALSQNDSIIIFRVYLLLICYSYIDCIVGGHPFGNLLLQI